MLADSDDLCDILNALAATGARLAIDDFGTGSSVLSRLQGFPFHTIKIDQSFINGITTETSVAVIAALVQMGTILGLEVVAEGVETELQRAALITLGCPLAQGFLFSRPVTPEVMSGLLLRGHLDGDRASAPAGR